MTDSTVAPRGFLRRPEPKAIGHPGRGEQIVDGALHLGGIALSGDFFAADLPPTVAAELHGFGWLDDLAAVGTPRARAIAQDHVLRWLRRHRQPVAGALEWAPEVTGRRVLRWIFHAGMILPGLDRDGAGPYFHALDQHLNHLRDSWYDSEDGLCRLEALAGLAIGAMSLRDRQAVAAPALIALAEEADAMGLDTLSEARSPEALLEAMALLVWAQEVAQEAGQDSPPELPAHGLAMGFARMARARTTLILDAAPPPGGPAAGRAHASTLAFELTVARQPLIVNCGPGDGFGPLWAKASRATPCHSALCLAGLSSSRLNPNRQEGEPDILTERPDLVWAGDCDALGNLTAPDCGPMHSPQPAHLLAGHDGWLASHGLTHLRELWLDPDGMGLRGEDSLAALDASAQARLDQVRPAEGLAFDIRFHLHPEVQARQQGQEIRLTLPTGDEWLFAHDGVGQLRLEASCLLDRALAEPRPSRQMVISAHLQGRAIQIGWTLARSGGR